MPFNALTCVNTGSLLAHANSHRNIFYFSYGYTCNLWKNSPDEMRRKEGNRVENAMGVVDLGQKSGSFEWGEATLENSDSSRKWK